MATDRRALKKAPAPCRGRSLPRGAGARERGFSLIVALMMLIVIIILGISASQMAINEERGARNDRDRQLAFQAAEAAIKEAEFEIYSPSSPACTQPGQRGRMRNGTQTCFNENNNSGYVIGCSSGTNAGLCLNNPTLPAYLDGNSIDFLADAKGRANPNTVAYGQYTGRSFPSQLASSLGAGQPVSAYPPRYIIELVPKNTSVDSLTRDGSGGGIGGNNMFRITAMGFGASANSQVVLQAIVATQD